MTNLSIFIPPTDKEGNLAPTQAFNIDARGYITHKDAPVMKFFTDFLIDRAPLCMKPYTDYKDRAYYMRAAARGVLPVPIPLMDRLEGLDELSEITESFTGKLPDVIHAIQLDFDHTSQTMTGIVYRDQNFDVYDVVVPDHWERAELLFRTLAHYGYDRPKEKGIELGRKLFDGKKFLFIMSNQASNRLATAVAMDMYVKAANGQDLRNNTDLFGFDFTIANLYKL